MRICPHLKININYASIKELDYMQLTSFKRALNYFFNLLRFLYKNLNRLKNCVIH